MKRKLDPRTVERVMNAAAATQVDTAREAAILGGIVRSLLDTGHLQYKFVAHMVPQALNWFNNTAREIHYQPVTTGERSQYVTPDMSMPTKTEIRPIAQRFIANYAPDTPIGVAA